MHYTEALIVNRSDHLSWVVAFVFWGNVCDRKSTQAHTTPHKPTQAYTIWVNWSLWHRLGSPDDQSVGVNFCESATTTAKAMPLVLSEITGILPSLRKPKSLH